MWNLSKIHLCGRCRRQLPKFSTNRRLMNEDLSNVPKDNQKVTSIYKKEGFFHSKTLLARQLHDNIVFNDSKKTGLIVVNKPFGLPLLPGETEDVSLTCALPQLASYLNVPNISVIKSSGKFISGCTLLNSGGERTLKHVTKCMARNRANRKLWTKYLAITNGIPRNSGVLETVDVSLETIKTKKSLKGGTYKEPVIRRELVPSTKIREGKAYGKNRETNSVQMNRVSVVADILARSRGNLTALVSIQPTGIEWNFICAYMANLLSPIIGDSQFSYRVKTILGNPVKVAHENSPIGQNINNLPRLLLGQLGVNPADEIYLPVHLHHFRTHLPGFFGQEDLNIYAALPKYFVNSANSLEININYKELETSDKILENSFARRKERKNYNSKKALSDH